LADGDKSTNFIDNPFSRAMMDIQNWSEEFFPNYYSTWEQNKSFALGTANFWADKVLKNLGFAVGAFASGMVGSGLFGSALRIEKTVANIVKGILATNGEIKVGSTILRSADEITTVLKSGKISPTILMEQLGRDAKLLKNKSIAQQVMGSTFGAIGESRIEALRNSDDFKNTRIQEKLAELGLQDVSQLSDKDREDLEEETAAFRNTNFWLNMAILSTSNFIQFGKSFSGGFNTQKKLLGDIRGNIREGFTADVPTTKFGKTLSNLKAIGKGLKNAHTEGSEEFLQTVANKTSEYYGRQYDPEAALNVETLVKGMGNGLKDSLGSSSAWEEYFIGAFTGALGIPTIAKVGGKKIHGGIWQDIAEQRSKNSNTKTAVDKLNQIINSDRFKNKYSTIVRHQSYQRDMDDALDRDDMFEYKNAEHEQFVSDMSHFIESGMYEEIKGHLESLGNQDVNELRQLNLRKEDDKTIDIFENKSDDEVQKIYRDRSKELVKKLQTIRDLKEDIDIKFTKASELAKKGLLFLASNMQNVNERLETLVDEVKSETRGYEIDKALSNETNTLGDVFTEKEARQAFIKGLEKIEKKDPLKQGISQKGKDILRLINRRIQFVTEYEKMVKNPELTNIMAKIREINNDIEESKNELDAKKAAEKYHGKDQELYDKETGEAVGKLKKVDNEFRIYKYDAKGNLTENYEVIDVTNKDFQNKYEVDTDIEEGGMSKRQRLELKRQINSITNPDDIAAFYVKEIKGKNFPNEDKIVEYLRTKWNELNNQQLSKEDFIKVLSISSPNLSKKLRMENLEKMIEEREKIISEISNKLNDIRVPIHTLRARLVELKTILSRKDGRRTAKSLAKLTNELDSIVEEVQVMEEIAKEYEQAIFNERKEVDILYERLDEEQNNYVNLKEKVDLYVQEIDTNEEIIKSYKSIIDNLKKLIEDILSWFKLKKQSREKGKSIDSDYYKELRNRIKQAGVALEKSSIYITADKIDDSLVQIDRLEKENEKLYLKLKLLEEESNKLKEVWYEHNKQKVVSSNVINPQENKVTEDTKVTDVSSGIVDENTLEKGVLRKFFDSAKRSLQNLFSGLASKHVNDDGTLIDDANNRAYYRFTNRTDLSKGEYSVRLEIDGSDNKYAEDWNKPIIKAYITKNGQYVNEFGNATTKDKSIYSYIPVSEGKENNTYEKDANKIEAEKQLHIERRKEIITKLNNGETLEFRIIGKGVGVPRTEEAQFGEDKINSVTDVVDRKDLTVKVATESTISIGGNIITAKPGFVYASDNSTGNIFLLQPAKLTEKDINLIVNMFMMFMSKHKQSGLKMVRDEDASYIKVIGEAGTLVTLTKDNNKPVTIFDILDHITFWTGNGLNEKGRAALKNAKEEKDLDEIYANPLFLENKNQSKAFHFRSSFTPGGHLVRSYLVIGGVKTPLFLNKDGVKIPNPYISELLKEFLSTQYTNVRSATLNNNRGFYMLDSLEQTEDGWVATVNESAEKEGGYINYLLDNNKLTTNVIRKEVLDETNKDEEVPQFLSQYAIIDYGEFNNGIKSEEIEDEDSGFFKVSSEELEELNTTSNKTNEQQDEYELNDEDLDKLADLDGMNSDTAKSLFPELFPDSLKRTPVETERLEDIEKAKAFIKKAFGDRIDVSIVDRLIEGKYWGEFKGALVKIYNEAGYGTGYHEAFHIVFNLILTEKEKKALIEEFKANRPNFTGNIEEELAEEFVDYMITKETTGTKKKSFFQKILDFINLFILKKPADIQTVFDRLSSGYYSDKPFTSTSTSKFKTPNGYTANQSKDIIEGINFFFFQELFGRKANVLSLYSKESNAELVNSIYKEVFEKLRKLYTAYYSQGKQSPNYEKALLLARVLLKDYNQFVKAHKEYLGQYKLETKELEDDWNKDVPEDMRSKDSGYTWASESLKQSNKGLASKSTKLFIGSLPAVDINGKVKLNGLGLPYNVDFGSTFNMLTNKLTNLTDFRDMANVLEGLAKQNPSLNILLKRLGWGRDIKSLSQLEFSQRLQFIQTFSTNQNEFEFDIVDEGGESSLISSNQNTAQKRILTKWKNSVPKNSKYISIDNTGTITYNIDELKKDFSNDIKTYEGALKFLKALGIEFSNIDYLNSITENKDKVYKIATAMYEQTVKNNLPYLYSNLEDADMSGNLTELANIEVNTTVDNIENSLFNIEGELIFGNTLNSYVTLIKNAINSSKTKEDLFKKMPHLRDVKYSLILDNLFDSNGKRRKDLKIFIHEGSKNEDKKVKFEKLKPGDKLRIIFNRTLTGSFDMIRPSDNAIERFVGFDIDLSSNDITRGKHLNILRDYLRSEMELSLTILSGDTPYRHLSNNAYKGIVIDIIKSTDAALYRELIKSINNNSIDLFLSKTDLINNALNKYIKQQTEDNIKLFEKYLLIKLKNDNTSFINSGLDKNILGIETDTGSYEHLYNTMKKFSIYYLIGNVEQIKLFYHSPQFFKTVEDEYKRHGGAVGTKKISITDEDTNTWINEYGDLNSDLKQQYVNNEPIIRTSVFNDLKVMSKYIDDYNRLLGKDAELYEEIEEADAQGVIHLDEYRRFLIRSGAWTFGKGSMEERYLYEKSIENYVDPVTGTSFKVDYNRVKNVTFNPLKPQHFGALAENGFILALYKISVYPLLPKLKEDFPVLDSLNKQMELQKTGVVLFASGNKVGTKLKDGKIQELYNSENKFAFDKNNKMTTQDSYYKFWGEQVSMGNKVKPKVVTGTQMMKQVINSLFNFGSPTSSVSGKVNKLFSINKSLIEVGKKLLVNDLGIEEVNGNYTVKDATVLINKLQKEAIERDLPDNLVNGIEYIRQNGVDILLNRNKVENILNALAESYTIKQRKIGGSKVQISTAMFEKDGFRTTKNKDGKEFITSNDLNFYGVEYNQDGSIAKVKACEIYLPNIFKGKVELGKIDERLLKIIGFRIPTQGLNSIESFVIKDFLPEGLGESVVLPTEIVAKTGSDFDIDKMYMYFNNFVRVKGEVKYLDRNYTYENYAEDLQEQLIRRIVSDTANSAQYGAIKKLIKDAYKYVSANEEVVELQDIIDYLEENRGKLASITQELLDDSIATLKEVIENDEDIAEAPISRLEYEKRVLENEMYEIFHEIILHPDNAKQLLTPITSADWKEMSLKVQWVKSGKKTSFEEFKRLKEQEIKNTPYNKLVELEYNLDVATRFLDGQTAIGITAIHSTFHILSQKLGLKIADTYTIFNTSTKKKETKSTKVYLQHNNNNGIQLGGINNVEGESIVNLLSQWINASVDAATDPFMFDMNVSPITMNVVLYLTMIGVPKETITYFINQPIILEYIHNLQSYGALFREAKFRDQIVAITKVKYGNTIEAPRLITEKELEDNITKPDNKLQLQILNDFLRYQDTTKFLGQAINSITYDTRGAGKSLSYLNYKLSLTDKAINDGVIEGYEKLINSDESFIKPYYEAVQNLLKVYDPLFKLTLQNPGFKAQYNKLLSIYTDENKTIAEDDVIDILDTFKNDFVLYLLMNREYNLNDTKQNRMVSEINRLFTGKDSLPKRIKEIQKKTDNLLLNNIQPIFGDKIDNLKLYITKLETIESNGLTEAWKELLNGLPEQQQLAYDLAKFIIIQSGLQNSPINFIQLMPVEIYNDIIQSIISKEDINTKYDDFFTSFFFNNWDNDNIVPKKTKNPKPGFPYYKVKEFVNIVGKDGKSKGKRFSGKVTFYSPAISIVDGREVVVYNEVNVKHPAIFDYRNNSSIKSYGVNKVSNEPIATTKVVGTDNTTQTKDVKQSKVEIVKNNYTRQEVQNNPNTAYVFTENTHSITAFPNRQGGGSAIIRGLSNSFAIVTKKKYDYNTRENVDYTDTPENFKEFTEINTKLINKLKNSGKSKIVFPQGFATDKATMPTRFAEWLQKALLDNFGLVTELNTNKTGLISKSVNQSVEYNKGSQEDLGNTVAKFMKTLSKEQREEFRKSLGEDFNIKCE